MSIIKAIDESNRELSAIILKKLWHTDSIIAKKEVHYFKDIPGFLCYEEGAVVGVITYAIENGECEIVTINSLKKKKGYGKKLFSAVLKVAKKEKCKRLWLITTNDNTNAMTFYQLIGMNMCGFYPNGMDYSRSLRPQIPLTGNLGIPLKHEIEFELLLDN